MLIDKSIKFLGLCFIFSVDEKKKTYLLSKLQNIVFYHARLDLEFIQKVLTNFIYKSAQRFGSWERPLWTSHRTDCLHFALQHSFKSGLAIRYLNIFMLFMDVLSILWRRELNWSGIFLLQAFDEFLQMRKLIRTREYQRLPNPFPLFRHRIS